MRWALAGSPIPSARSVHMPVDPSCKDMFLSSKIVIEAARQLESEGGPEIFPDDNLSILEERDPERLKLVESKWEDNFKEK